MKKAGSDRRIAFLTYTVIYRGFARTELCSVVGIEIISKRFFLNLQISLAYAPHGISHMHTCKQCGSLSHSKCYNELYFVAAFKYL